MLRRAPGRAGCEVVRHEPAPMGARSSRFGHLATQAVAAGSSFAGTSRIKFSGFGGEAISAQCAPRSSGGNVAANAGVGSSALVASGERHARRRRALGRTACADARQAPLGSRHSAQGVGSELNRLTPAGAIRLRRVVGLGRAGALVGLPADRAQVSHRRITGKRAPRRKAALKGSRPCRPCRSTRLPWAHRCGWRVAAGRSAESRHAGRA